MNKVLNPAFKHCYIAHKSRIDKRVQEVCKMDNNSLLKEYERIKNNCSSLSYRNRELIKYRVQYLKSLGKI